jgi:hypothetical protein
MLSPGGNTLNFSRGGHSATCPPTLSRLRFSKRRPLAALPVTLAHPLNASSGCGFIAAAGVAMHDLGELLPNIIGERMTGEVVQRAIVGEHRDFEPAPTLK